MTKYLIIITYFLEFVITCNVFHSLYPCIHDKAIPFSLFLEFTICSIRTFKYSFSLLNPLHPNTKTQE